MAGRSALEVEAAITKAHAAIDALAGPITTSTHRAAGKTTSPTSTTTPRRQSRAVEDFTSTFRDEHANVAQSLAANSVTSLVLGKSNTVDNSTIDSGFIIVAVLCCPPQRALAYAVDPH